MGRIAHNNLNARSDQQSEQTNEDDPGDKNRPIAGIKAK
jgi:hypothetical protein